MSELDDRELDALIAERLFDWRWFHCVADTGAVRNQFCNKATMEIWRGEGWKVTPIQGPISGELNDPSACPRFSEDIASAMLVLNHLRPQFEDSFCGFYQLRDDEGALIQKWEAACVFERDIFLPNARVQFDDPSEAITALAKAICLAALEATKNSE